ncbi:hypothetical protein [Bosea lathyri]|uniref:Ca2+-binding protein, RTX toxin-related n=1 Tax=Bosea lathyri TaxID=1036778 RepID=A0A1H6CIU5_9HYPH|nr:hypothetical protein [Bosea lathyri]SEG72869.1 Ca2+-binding protein, RTX toxin-related [Bosea lathyri]
MTNWLAANKESLNIQFVGHVGDVTQNNQASEWAIAEKAMRTLDGKIPYSLLPGNHDQASGGSAADHSSVFLDTVFSPEKQAATNPGTFGGVYDQESASSRNNYHTFTATDGTKWLILSMEFGPRDDVIRWAGEVIETNLDHRVMIISHSLTSWAGRHDPASLSLYDEGTGADYGMRTDPQGANDGETVYRMLSAKYPNVAFTFSGHIFGDGAETNVSYSQYGNPIHETLVNYQNGISREITGNGNEALGTRGGNGAIRLVTIDPENNTIFTSTYFTELDDYLDGYRGKPELDRDGLTGYYRGHQEVFENVDLGTPELMAMAKAGNDKFVKAEAGQDKASVTFDGDWTLNPGNDTGLTYRWTDRDGNILSESARPTLELQAGRHEFTLSVTDTAGYVTTDTVTAIVSTDNTLLLDSFNDANRNGWVKPSVGIATKTGTVSSFNLPALPGGDATVTYIPALSSSQIVGVVGADSLPAGTVLKSYSLVYDLLVPAGQGAYFSFLQTDLTNRTDGELFLKQANAASGGIGINSDYEGAFTYGAWHRVAFTVEDKGTSVLISKYIDGVKVGDTPMSGSNYARYALDLNKGFFLFADESGETSGAYVSSVLITDKIYSEAEMGALGGPKAGGIVATPPSDLSSQINFSSASSTLSDDFGKSIGIIASIPGASNFLVKGSAAARTTTAEQQAAPEGRVFEQSDSANNILVWNDPAAQDWSNYVYEATLRATDNDGIGLVFAFKDTANHYRLVLDAETNSRKLVKLVNGVETVLASETGGTPWNRDFALKVAMVDGRIDAFLDGHSLFGTVTDTAPLAGGTVGFYSNNQRSSQFDNVTVTKVALTAHAGDDARVIDLDGDGRVTVSLEADGSYGLADIASYVWTDETGNVVAEGKTADANLSVGRQTLTLTVTDTTGKTATDTKLVEGIAKSQVLVSETFADASALARWTIVDEGELGGVGANGKSSQWELTDGQLVQLSDLKSRELTWSGATNADYWKRGWSPLGDGVNMLRRGTQAVYNDPAAKEWADYAVEAMIKTPDNGALGFLVHYVDAKNYYKIELNAEGTYDRSAGNGAGSIFQLLSVSNGVERVIMQMPGKYTPGQVFNLRVEIKDQKIQALVDGVNLFAYAIEDHANPRGTFALYSWGNVGLSFDDVTVVDLRPILAGTEGDDIITGSAGDDVIRGFDGDDALAGGNGNDRIEGGAGDDTLDGGDGDDRIEGGAGDDVISGGNGADLIFGGEGDDRIDAGAGDDTIELAIGAGAPALIDGGEGSDSLILSGSGVGTLDTVTGVEHLVVGSGSWSVAESEAFDDIRVKAGAVLASTAVLSGSHRLTVEAGATVAAVTLSGALNGARLDNAGEITGGIAADATATGTLTLVNSGRIAGGIVTGAGDDSVTLLEGSAVTGAIALGAGQDVFIGSLANETVDGGAGDDLLKGAGGDDTIAGGAGFDTLDLSDATGSVSVNWQAGTASGGGIGSDRFSGIESVRLGSGDDQLRGSAADEIVDGGAGKDTLDAGSGNDRLTGGAGDDALRGGSGDDALEGGDGKDLLEGGSGNDRLSGGAGEDDLRGGSGDDRINGGAGNDRLSGGSGHDVFVFEKGFGRDVISDFQASGSSADQLEFATSLLADYAAFTAAATQAGRDVVITLDAETALTLTNVTLASLQADDFRFV